MAPARACAMHHVKPQFNGRDDDDAKNYNDAHDSKENAMHHEKF